MLEDCIVCFEPYNIFEFQIQCNHALCSKCYLKIFEVDNLIKCPYCRRPIQIDRILIRRPICKLNMRRFQNIRTLLQYKYCLFKGKKRSKERHLKHKILRLALGITAR